MCNGGLVKYADSIREFIPAYVRNALVLQTPYQVFSAWLNRQTFLSQNTVDFNKDGVLAIDCHKVYGEVEREMLDTGKIRKLHVNYGDVAITLYVPADTTVNLV